MAFTSWEDNAAKRLMAARLPREADKVTIYQDPRDRGRFHVVAKRGEQVWNLRLTAMSQEEAEAQVREAMSQ